MITQGRYELPDLVLSALGTDVIISW